MTNFIDQRYHRELLDVQREPLLNLCPPLFVLTVGVLDRQKSSPRIATVLVEGSLVPFVRLSL